MSIMKKAAALSLALAWCALGSAQTHIRVWQNDDSDRIKIANVGDMVFKDGTVTIKGSTYKTADIDSIIVVPEITVTYSEGAASVYIPAAVKGEVTAVVDGADVTITNTNEANEMEFILAGEASDGSFTYNGSYKCTIELAGLTLTSKKGSAMDLECGKRISLVIDEGTTNSLADAAGGSQKACLYSKGHLEVGGAGTLNISGNKNHALSSKEYVQLKKSTGTINIVSAANDGLHVGQYFQMNGGTLTLDANTKGDGVQVEELTNSDGSLNTDKENNGQIILKGGNISMTINSEDCKGLKTDGLVSISGGTVSIDAVGNGSRGIQTDGNMVIGEEDNSTNITINAKGGKCTITADKSDPHRCMGIKVDGTLTINAGTVTVTNTGSGARGIKATEYHHNGGNVSATITS